MWLPPYTTRTRTADNTSTTDDDIGPTMSIRANRSSSHLTKHLCSSSFVRALCPSQITHRHSRQWIRAWELKSPSTPTQSKSVKCAGLSRSLIIIRLVHTAIAGGEPIADDPVADGLREFRDSWHDGAEAVL